MLRAHPLRVLRRLWLLLRILASFAFVAWLNRQPWASKDPEVVKARERRAAVRFREALVELGPTFIKIGQLLATRPDLLPLTYTKELAVLQDRVPPFETPVALQIIREELGKDAHEIFARFDMEPLSAASIGQVYRARLHSGEEVIVKVQRPNLPEVIALDLAILRRMAQWATGKDLVRYGVPVAKDMPYVAIADRLATSLYEQIDFVREAENIEKFRRNFRDFPMVTAPKPYRDYTTTRVLTEEFIEGFKFDDYEGIKGAGLDYIEVANLGVRAFIKQVLEDGFFHADTHPGNILIRPNGEVVYIDFGMVDGLPEESQHILVDLFIHLVHLNFDGFITDLIKLDFLPETVDRERILPIVEDIYTTQMGLTGETYSLKEILDRVSEVMYDYPFFLPERFAFLMRSVGSMEGVVLEHEPTYKFLNVGLPFAGKLMLNPEKRFLRDKLFEDLMEGDRLRLDRLLELFEYAAKEPTFRIGELAPMAISYLLSAEARPHRNALTVSVLTREMMAEDSVLDRIIVRLLADPSFTAQDAVMPLFAFLKTHDGLEWLEVIVPRLRHIAPGAGPVRHLVPMLGALRAHPDSTRMIGAAFAACKVMLSDRALSLQPVVDWLAAWFETDAGRELILEGADFFASLSPSQRDEVTFIATLALEHPELDLSVLVGQVVNFLTTPDAAPVRALGFEWFASGRADQAMVQLFQRTLFDKAMRGELVASLLPTLRYLSSPEASDTRLQIISSAWRRLTSFLPSSPHYPSISGEA